MTQHSIRVSAFIDGFNLYHAIANEAKRDPCLADCKWLNLRALCETYAPSPQLMLGSVYYFSAFATWLEKPYRRHQIYTGALAAVSVDCVMGQFKEKDRKCRKCGARWKGHEEKESDVALSVRLVSDAFLDLFDRALVITADSDVAPALREVRRRFPEKSIQVLTPPGLIRSNELYGAAGGQKNCQPIKWINIERSLFPREVKNNEGRIVAVRPPEYDPLEAD